MPGKIDLDIQEIAKLYKTDNLTTVEIAKLFSVSTNTILDRLNKANIQVDYNKFTRITLDGNVLYKLYVEDNLTANEIGKKFNVTAQTILKELKRNNIFIKNRGTYEILPERQYSFDEYSFFDGLVAGDGNINRKNNRSNAKVRGTFKYEEFAHYIAKALNIKKTDMTWSNNNNKKEWRKYYSFCSDNNVLFTKEYIRWYPLGVKIVPSDFRFNPKSINILYLCDGGVSRNRSIILHTNAFSKDNLENTLIYWFKNIGIKCSITKKNQIYVSTKSSQDFLDYIGECPVSCYKYKWNLGRYE